MQRADLPDGKAALRFSVIDTGIGLTQDARTHLFEGFAKGSDKAAGGMGLGLAISDRLVRLMGGHIEVDSAPGQGSTFWFLLPCETSDAAPLTVPAPAAETSSRARSQRFIDQDYLYEMERELGLERTRAGLARRFRARSCPVERVGHSTVDPRPRLAGTWGDIDEDWRLCRLHQS